MDDSQNNTGNARDPQHLAEMLLRKHQLRALKIAANRAMRLGIAGDRAGALEWLEISVCVREMLTRRVPGPSARDQAAPPPSQASSANRRQPSHVA